MTYQDDMSENLKHDGTHVKVYYYKISDFIPNLKGFGKYLDGVFLGYLLRFVGGTCVYEDYFQRIFRVVQLHDGL